MKRSFPPLIAGLSLSAILLCGCPQAEEELVDHIPSWPLEKNDRILVLAPHPDDEVIACGGLIQQCAQQGIPVHVAFLTYGDNNQWSFMLYRKHPVLSPAAVQAMGEVRHGETIRADHTLGLAPEHLTFLGYPDFGTLHIWDAHWGAAAPFQSMLTRVTAVPYANALEPSAPYKGESIVRNLESVIQAFQPTKIMVSHPADHNPDHQALYLFTRIALWNLETEIQPQVWPYLVHFKRWPAPKSFQPQRALAPPLTLDAVAWHTLALSSNEVAVKAQAIRQHATQYAYAAAYLSSFIRKNELFGEFPEVPLWAQPKNNFPVDGRDAPGETEPSEELSDTEASVYTGIDGESIRMDDSNLVATITFSKPMARTVGVSLLFFGYHPGRAFEHMPKLHIRFGLDRVVVLDQQTPLPQGTVQVESGPRSRTVHIPLAVLGNPDRVLCAARTYLGEVPLDWAAWRILRLYPPN